MTLPAQPGFGSGRRSEEVEPGVEVGSADERAVEAVLKGTSSSEDEEAPRDRPRGVEAAGGSCRKQATGCWRPYGQIVDLDITGLDAQGDGQALHDGIPYRVEGALPGERVRARIVKRDHGTRLAHTVEICRPAPDRVAPACVAFGTCGGCTWQNLAYDSQVAWLTHHVHKALVSHGVAVPPEAWRPLRGAAAPWSYRGKVEFTFGGAAGEVTLGFNRRGVFDRVVDVPSCAIAPPVATAITERVRAWANRQGLAPFRMNTREGFLRFLVVRQAYQHPSGIDAVGLRAEDPWIAALVTTPPLSGDWGAADLVAALRDVPGEGSVVHVMTSAPASTVNPTAITALSGTGRLEATLGNLRFGLSFASFFQANQAMAEELVRCVNAGAALSGTERVLDLFCGVGTLALGLAARARHVTGVEVVPEAVADARANARLNDLSNVTFVEAAAERFAWDPNQIDVLLLDPPRCGLHPRLARGLRERPVSRVVYVSCNPEALATDLVAMQESYVIRDVQSLDLFPQTPHVETVVVLERRR